LDAEDKQEEYLRVLQTHRTLVHKVCHLYGHTEADREDIFQEICFQLWKAWPGFRGESKVSTWIYRIALNTAITGLRKKKGHVVFLDRDAMPDAPAEEKDHAEEERRKTMYDAIRGLSEWERAVVMLYLEDKSYEEMEEILGVTQNNLRVRMTRIREKLRKSTQTGEHGTR
jgi:RNA polymerase sigma-70 factor (ECF subfamily)